MYNPNTLSKMAAQNRRDIHHNEMRRRLAKECNPETHQPNTNLIQSLLGFIQKSTGRMQQPEPMPQVMENTEGLLT